MSNTVITNYTDLNGPSTKADSSVVVIVNKDGSLSVDQNLLGTLMGTDGSQSSGISVVRVGHEGRPDDATDSENEDDDKIPHVTLTVDSYYNEPNSIIKYDSGAEMLQSLRIETRENSLVGFHNDHCYTSLTSPSQVVSLPHSERNESFTTYKEPVIQISHTPPPKPVPSNKKITILDQKILPKGKKIQLKSDDLPVIMKGNDILTKPLQVMVKANDLHENDKIADSLKRLEESATESSSMSSSGDSVADRDSDSDYKDQKLTPIKPRKAKLKPRILKTLQSAKTSKLDSKSTPKLKAPKVKKEVKDIRIPQKVIEKKPDQDIDLETLLPTSKIAVTVASNIEFNKTVLKQTPKVVKKEKKTPAHVTALLSDMTSLFSTPDVIRRVSTDNKPPGKGEKEIPSDAPSAPKIIVVKNQEASEIKPPETTRMIEVNKGKITRAPVPVKKEKENMLLSPVEKAKGCDLIPQIDDDSLAQILQDTEGITSSPVKASALVPNALNSPGLAGPMSPTLDLGLQPTGLEEGLSEDLLLHVAHLVQNSDKLQEVIDTQVLNIEAPDKTPVQSPFQQAFSQSLAKSAQKTVQPKEKPIQIVRSDGRVITLPPIEAPATRSSKRKSQLEPTPVTTAEEVQTPQVFSPQVQVEPPIPEPHVLAISKQYINKKLPNKKPEQDSEAPILDKISAESQESWNSEDDPYRLWCICKQPHNNRFMICCDGCEDWFHGKCVNITKAMGQQMEEQGIEWRCPNCIKKTKSTQKAAKTLTAHKKNESPESYLGQLKSSLPREGSSRPNCIVCKKPARASSIYCSDTCILKHAQDSLGNSPPTKEDADSGRPLEKQKSDASRVIVYERKSGRLLAGPNAPTAGELKTWLQRNPTFEVVRPGALSSIRPGLKKKEPKRIQTTLNFERTPKNIPEQSSSSPVRIPQSDIRDRRLLLSRKDNSTPAMKAPPSPKPQSPKPVTPSAKPVTPSPKPVTPSPKLVTPSPKPVTPSPKPVTPSPKPVTPSPKPVTQSPKPVTPSPKPVTPAPKPVTPSPRPNPIQLIETPKPSSSATKPAIEPRKLARSSLSRYMTNEKPPAASPSSSRRKDSTQAESKSRMTSTDPIRDNVRKSLQEQMSLRMNETKGAKFTEDEIQQFAVDTEIELHDLFRDVGMKYKAKYRSLIFNIKDRKNLSLWQKICDKSITPQQLVRLTPDEMASQELSEWRDQESKYQLELIKKSELDLLAASKTYVLKTHKGEEVMETKESVSTELDPNVPVEDLVIALNDSTVGEEVTREVVGEISKPKVEEKKESKSRKRERDASSSRSKKSRRNSSPAERRRSRRESDRKSRSSRRKSEYREKVSRSERRSARRAEKKSKARSISRDRSKRDSKEKSDSERSRHRSRSRDKIKRSKSREKSRSASKSREKSRSASISREKSRSASKGRERERSLSRGRARRRSDSKEADKRKRRSISKPPSGDDKLKLRSRSQDNSYSKNKTDSTDSDSIERPKSALLKEPHPEYDPHEPMITSAFSEEDLRKSEDAFEDTYKSEILDSGIEYDPTKMFTLDSNILSSAPLEKQDKSAGEAESDQEPSSTVENASAVIWNGCINMVDIARFYVSAHEVSGSAMDLEEELCAELDIVGRINPETVWDYINKTKQGTNKDIVLLRLQAANDEEKMQYFALYSYLSSRNRLGVVKVPNSTTIKDFYIIPVPANTSLPKVLLPLNGPGLGDVKTHLLIAVIIRQRKKRVPPNVQKDLIPAKVARESRKRSYTPPVVGKSSYTPPTSPKRRVLPLPTYPASSLSSSVKDQIAASLACADDGDEAYSPGGSSSSSNSAPAPAVIAPPAAPSATVLRSKMEELNRQIEEQKQQIMKMAQADSSMGTEDDEAYSPSRPMTPPPSVSTLADIALPSNLHEILATIKQRSENQTTDVDMRNLPLP